MDNCCKKTERSNEEKSSKSLANIMFENHLYRCISNDLEKGNIEVIDELTSLFKRFND